MGMVKVNPAAEVSNYNPVKAGVYLMKIEKHEEKQSAKGNDYLNWRLSFTDPAERLMGIDGQALKGKPGSVFLMTMLAPDMQWKLRSLVEAALGEWRDFNPTELYGKEVTCKIAEEEYEGNIRNIVDRVIQG